MHTHILKPFILIQVRLLFLALIVLIQTRVQRVCLSRSYGIPLIGGRIRVNLGYLASKYKERLKKALVLEITRKP